MKLISRKKYDSSSPSIQYASKLTFHQNMQFDLLLRQSVILLDDKPKKLIIFSLNQFFTKIFVKMIS